MDFSFGLSKLLEKTNMSQLFFLQANNIQICFMANLKNIFFHLMNMQMNMFCELNWPFFSSKKNTFHAKLKSFYE